MSPTTTVKTATTPGVMFSAHRTHARSCIVVFSERDYVRIAICDRNSVCRLFVVCLSSVTLVHHTQLVVIFGIFFTIRQHRDSSFLMPKFVGGGRPFPPKICAESDPFPFRAQRFRPKSAHSAATVIASDKSSISTYRKSTTRFPTSHR